jgi:hypothetical protein
MSAGVLTVRERQTYLTTQKMNWGTGVELGFGSFASSKRGSIDGQNVMFANRDKSAT